MLGEKVGTFTGTTTDKVMPAQGGLPHLKLLLKLVENLLVQNANQWPLIQRKCNQTGVCMENALILELL